jgi:multicomponent Na+:H+ antiporter subunit D
MMMSALLLLAIAIPLAHAALVSVFNRPPGLRDVIHIGGSLALAVVCAMILARAAAGETGAFVIARPLPGLELAFSADRLGAVFALLAASLGALCAMYTVGWMRVTRDASPTRFMAFAALALAMTVGVALSANLFTFFVFYEGLVIVTFPLLGHRSDTESGRAAGHYLVLTLALAMGALLPAIVWTSVAADTLAFTEGGILEGRVGPIVANVLLVFYVLGIGMAALFPAHRWITAASIANAPASALVFAVTAASVGGFGVLRIAVHVFGEALSEARFATLGVLVIAAITLIGASLAAFSHRDLSKRLSYLCVAQLAGVSAGAMLGPAYADGLAAGWFAAVIQLIAYSAATATLCFCIGAIEAATGRTRIDEIDGLGRRMPWIFAALVLGALSFAGAPPLAGAWPKLWLMIAASDHGYYWLGVAVAAGSLIAFAAFVAPVARALFAPEPAGQFAAPDGAPVLVILPTAIAGLSTLMLLVWLNPIVAFLGDLRGVAP